MRESLERKIIKASGRLESVLSIVEEVMRELAFGKEFTDAEIAEKFYEIIDLYQFNHKSVEEVRELFKTIYNSEDFLLKELDK